MKNLITIILFIFISNLSFGQIQAVKAGNYYELNDLWKRDSISVKQLMDTYKLDISNLVYVKFFGDFELSQELHDNYSYTTYVYALDKKTGVVTMESIPHVKKYQNLTNMLWFIVLIIILTVKLLILRYFNKKKGLKTLFSLFEEV